MGSPFRAKAKRTTDFTDNTDKTECSQCGKRLNDRGTLPFFIRVIRSTNVLFLCVLRKFLTRSCCFI